MNKIDITIFKIISKLLILISALTATSFGIVLLFFYEQFRVFNELVNNRYLVRKKGHEGGKYLLDNWVMEWHTGIGVISLLIGIWLFWVFFRYLFL